MAIQLDPAGNETVVLHDLLGDLTGLSVLEIGCGDGRLIWRYAERAGHVLGFDPKQEMVALAQQNCPEHLRERVTFQTADLETFAREFLPRGERFDRAILAWSL